LTGWRRYLADDDRLVAAGNLLAVTLATSQPTYPLYVWLTAGEGALRASVVLLAVPFFLLVPLLARRRPMGARVLLVGVSIANTLVCARVLGSEAGVEALFMSCGALAAALFRASERWVMLVLVGAAIAAWLLAEGHPGGFFSAEAYAGLRRMNAVSAIAVCGLIGWMVPRR